MNIFTDRLILRKFVEQDKQKYIDIMKNKNITMYLGDRKPKSEKDIENILIKFKNHWEEKHYGVWAITIKDTGELIGQCGYLYVEQEDSPELLYMIDEKYWGKGYGYEAAKAVLSYGKENYRWEKILAMAYAENIPSNKIIQKLKFENIGTINMYNSQLNLYQYKF